MLKIIFSLLVINTFLFSSYNDYKRFIDYESFKNKQTPGYLKNKELELCNNSINKNVAEKDELLLEIGFENKKLKYMNIKSNKGFLDSSRINYALCVKDVLINDENLINKLTNEKIFLTIIFKYNY